MPELWFTLRWPDDSRSRCYSPSSTITDFFEVGQAYPLDVFLERSRAAMTQASERVRARYGYACSASQEQLHAIETKAAEFTDRAQATVRVEGFER